MNKMKAVISAMGLKQNAVAADMGISSGQLSKLLKERDDQATMKEVTAFCSATSIPVSFFVESNAEQLGALVRRDWLTSFLPKLTALSVRSGQAVDVRDSMYDTYNFVSASLSAPKTVQSSILHIGDVTGVVIQFQHVFHFEEGNQLSGEGVIIPCGDSLFAIGEYDSKPIHLFNFVLKPASVNGERWSTLTGIATGCRLEGLPAVGACRIVAVNGSDDDELVLPLGVHDRASIADQDIYRQIFGVDGNVQSLMVEGN